MRRARTPGTSRRPSSPRPAMRHTCGCTAATWNRRGGSASERFDYLYSDDELREWVAPLRELEQRAETVWVMFNNNGRSVDTVTGGEIAQAPVNALTMQELLAQHTAAR